MNRYQTGDKHVAAQNYLVSLLSKHYLSVRQEIPFPVPNPKYLYDPKQRPTITYWFDVFAMSPRNGTCSKYDQLGIEVDGSVGHKRTKYQSIRDQQRTDSLELEYNFLVHRFDPEQITGNGYMNPKTKKITKPWSPIEILQALGVNSKVV